MDVSNVSKLERYRQDQGLSYKELAEILNLSKSTTHRVCTSADCGISLRVAKQIVASIGPENLRLEEICA